VDHIAVHARTIKRVRSDGSILYGSNTSISGCSGCHNEDKELLNAAPLDVKSGSQFPVLESDSVHGNEISLTCESEVSNLRLVSIRSRF
jgi:hypothetical protein